MTDQREPKPKTELARTIYTCMEQENFDGYDFCQIPFDRIKSMGQINMMDSDLIGVSCLLGRYCNYKCSYCWTHGRSPTKDHRPTKLYLNMIDSVKEQARDRGFNSFRFSFSGGEPTLHPGYLDMLRKLSDDAENTNYTNLHMTTNLSRGFKWFEKYIEATKKVDRISITASYHHEFVPSAKEFAEKINMLKSNSNIYVIINIVMVRERFDEFLEMGKYFHSKGINTTLKPMSDTNAEYILMYSKEQYDIMKTGFPRIDDKNKKPDMQVVMLDDENKRWYMDQAERFNAFDFNNFAGWKCVAGYRTMMIREPGGVIRRCCSNPEELGNIETGFKLHDKATICHSTKCVSSLDTKLPKFKK